MTAARRTIGIILLALGIPTLIFGVALLVATLHSCFNSSPSPAEGCAFVGGIAVV